MTDKYQELRATLAQATEGPWHVMSDGSIEASGRRVAYVQNGGIVYVPDANLIALSRNHLPELLAERDALVAERAALRSEVKHD